MAGVCVQRRAIRSSGISFVTSTPRLKLDASCNWGGMSLEDASALSFPGGFDLKVQLERYRPEIVVGDGTHLFVISLRPEVIATVRRLDEAATSACSRRRLVRC